MMVWTCNSFKGLWPVPTAAVVVASCHHQAWELLDAELKRIHLDGLTERDRVIPLDADDPHVVILSAGDY